MREDLSDRALSDGAVLSECEATQPDSDQIREAKRVWRRLIEEAAEQVIRMWPYRMTCNKSRALSGIDVSIKKSWENHTERFFVYWLDVEFALSSLSSQEKKLVEQVYWKGMPNWLIAQTLRLSRYECLQMRSRLLWRVANVVGLVGKELF